MNLEYSKGILFVRFDGILNRKSTYKVNNYLLPIILKHKIKYLVLNLFKLEALDEEGIDALLNIKTAVKNNKGLIYLCEVSKILSHKVSKLHIKKIANELSAFETIEV